MQRTPVVLHDKDENYYKYLKNNNLIIFESVVGSQAYGTNIATSDEDRKFIFIEPLEKVLIGTHVDQLNVNKDYVGYELGRFLELLESSNPNINELLFAPEHTIKFIHPLFSEFVLSNKQKFLTKSVYHSFGGYSISQIKKARGTNKKIVNPIEKVRKGLLDFCWVSKDQGSEPLKEYLSKHGIVPDMCGCVAIDHMKNCYHLFVDDTELQNHWWNQLVPTEQKIHGTKKPFTKEQKEKLSKLSYEHLIEYYKEHNCIYKGITDVDDVQILLSSVKKGLRPTLMFYCNLEGFQSYCKDYREYWEWE